MYVYANVSEHDSVYAVHSIEFKFGMYGTGHRQTNPIDFGEYRMNCFSRGVQKKFLYITANGVKSFKVLKHPNSAFDCTQIWYVYYKSPSNKPYSFW